MMDQDNKRINGEIRQLAIPNIISNITVPLMGSVDTWLMGQLSASSLAAVGVGSMVFNFLYWNMGFLRMGTTGMTAQAFGRDDRTEMSGTLIKAVLLALSIGVLLILIRKPVFDLSMAAMSIAATERPMIWSYFSILIIAAPAMLLMKVLLGWFFGMQNAKFPLYVTLIINAVNIVLSLWLVRHLGWGIHGAAWGTFIAQYLGVVICLILLALRYRSLLDRSAYVWKSIRAGFSRLLSVNLDIFVRTVFLSTAFMLIFRFSRETGPDILAINVIFLQYLNWMSYAIDGFAYASESLVGKYKGARNAVLLGLSIKWNMRWAFAFALLFTLVYGLFSRSIFRLFIASDDGSLLSLAEPYFIWMAILPLVAFASYIWDGIFIGLTASRSMRNSMVAAFAVYIGAWFFLPASLSNHRIWLAFFFFLVGRATFMWLMYRWKGWEGVR